MRGSTVIIEKLIVDPNGVTTPWHFVKKVVVAPLEGAMIFTVYSYTEYGRALDMVPPVRAWEFSVPLGAALGISVGETHTLLLGSPPSPLANGTVHATDLTEYGQALRKQLATARHLRDVAEFGPFTYNGMTFDGDLDAQRRLSGLVSAAKSTIAAGHTFTKDFTLADNSVVQLSAEDFIGIEMAKLWQVDEAFQVYRAKKAAIEAATTVEELEAIVPTA